MRFDMHNLKVIPYPLYDIHFALYLIVSMLGDPSPPTGLLFCLFVCWVVDLSTLIVRFSVVMSVCLFVTYRSVFSTDLHESSPHGRAWLKEEGCCF